jgi:hypothetical protein
LSDWLSGLDVGRGREHAVADQHVNLSWALLNLIRWARHTDDDALVTMTRSVMDVHLRPAAVDTACPVSRDAGADVRGFIPPCLMRLGAIAELDGAAAKSRVALFVDLAVDGRRSATSAAAADAIADLIGGLVDGGPDPTSAQQLPIGPRAVRLVGQYPVRAGPARPGPGRGTRIPASTAANCGLSAPCPAVSTMDKGLHRCSQARSTLAVQPPRERPNA